MESLSDTAWDVIIAGTGLSQALLALALSRADKKVLHVDKNEYYGGHDAALSLREAGDWVEEVNKSDNVSKFRDARIRLPSEESGNPISKILEQSRKYTLSLSPQLIYAQSKLLPALVASRVHTQLEFQAVGSWWVYRDGKLQRIPSGREDVFADDTLPRRDKIALMKFLRSVTKEPDSEDGEETDVPSSPEGDISLASLLESEFKISPALHQPLLALSLSPSPAKSTRSSYALPRIKRHMSSIGAFGPGFGAVLSKYGGNAEIVQVGCRAGAVGGGVYVLGADIVAQESTDDSERIKISLSNGEKITTSYIVGGTEDLSRTAWNGIDESSPKRPTASFVHQIHIISSTLKQLFPQTSENGPVPAGAIVLVDNNEVDLNIPPIYLQVHSEDTGECPAGQCVVYGSSLVHDIESEEETRERLRTATETVIQACDANTSFLWEMTYISESSLTETPENLESVLADGSSRILALQTPPEDIAFDDCTLENVKEAWKMIMGPAADDTQFLRFEERAGEEDEED